MQLSTYQGVVWDLDGTLVHLDVDWDDVAQAVAERFEREGIGVDSYQLWDMLTLASEYDIRQDIESIISAYEREGAHSATLAPGAAYVGNATVEGVCSLNSESACRVALEKHALKGSIQSIIGRDTVAAHKPDPLPLKRSARNLDIDMESMIFIGDSITDKQTAEAAGMDFAYLTEIEGSQQ
jgi:phosphoglycolate phosphatase